MAEPPRVGILISGRGSNMTSLVEHARINGGFEIAIVISNNPDAAGLAIAEAAGIPTWARSHRDMPRAAFDALVDAELRASDVAIVVLAGYMRLLSPEFIAGWEGRILNIHPSLLPAYKGLDTHARAIATGEKRAGCSVHIVTPELDDGPVIARAEVDVLPDDTPETLAARILLEEHRLYPEALAVFAASLRVDAG